MNKAYITFGNVYQQLSYLTQLLLRNSQMQSNLEQMDSVLTEQKHLFKNMFNIFFFNILFQWTFKFNQFLVYLIYSYFYKHPWKSSLMDEISLQNILLYADKFLIGLDYRVDLEELAKNAERLAIF